MATPSTGSSSIDDILAPCHGAYSARTTKGYRADLRIFVDWCAARNVPWLPAAPQVVAAFVDDQIANYRISTLKRRLCAIAFAHRMMDLPTPSDANVVRLAVRRAARQKVSRPQQKRGLTHAIRATILAACPETMAGLRDAALVSVGYDTLCRCSELSAMLVENVKFQADGAGSVLIPRSKADVAGAGRIAHLSPDTARLLRGWLNEAGVNSGPLFRSLHMHRVADGPLATS